MRLVFVDTAACEQALLRVRPSGRAEGLGFKCVRQPATSSRTARAPLALAEVLWRLNHLRLGAAAAAASPCALEALQSSLRLGRVLPQHK